MVIDGRSIGQRMAVTLIGEVFSMLAADFAAGDRDGALAALGRIELTIADALADFRLQTAERTRTVYDEAFDAMIETISTLVEDARNAVQASGKPTV